MNYRYPFVALYQNLQGNTIYDILAEKTKMDAKFWRENMKSDMFLTSEQLLSYGLIDQII